ncbi:MAG: hypothetical protein IJK98_00495, partial [Clostridia bacterium]|nr:hypothetical protein [Clostridia bacterium]
TAKCDTCGVAEDTITDEGSQLDHVFTNYVSDNNATCTADGTKPAKCDLCGEAEDTVTDEGSKLDHTPSSAVKENEVAATCKDEGSYDEVVYCSVCGAELSRENKSIEKLTTHTPGEAVKENEVAATCAADGSYDMAVYCTVCGSEISRETHVIPAGHTAGEIVKENESAPTCTEAGSYDAVVYCTECGEEMSRDTVTVPAKGHVWGEWEVVTPATEEADGEAKRVCAACGAEETKAITDLGEEITKTVKFVNLSKMCYVLDLGDGETYTVYNSSTVQWISNRPLKFRVVTYSDFAFRDVIVRVNGREVTPDADGYYILPQTAETAIVTVEGAVPSEDSPNGKLSFWELLIQFFKKIVSFFSTAFGKQSIC